ncbi:MAG TPA: ATP-binding protein [Ktedonobacteraceae bacterium]
MVTHDLPLQEPLASEVTRALIDLAQLSEQVGSIGFHGLSVLANQMLMRLLALCEAERGAVLLNTVEPTGFETGVATQATLSHSTTDTAHTHLSPKAYRAFASHDRQDEEVHALLVAFPPVDAHIHTPGLSCWITYRLSPDEFVPESAQSLAAASAYPADLGIMHDLHEILLNQTRQQLQALLVLGWTGEHGSECALAVERCHTVLPLVADAAWSVIASILLAERVHELESSAVREALQGMELLNAELLGTVSHELRSPLASIKGYAATLLRHERRLSREERHQFLLAINEASERMGVIIERLLEVSQLETGQIVIQRSPVDVAHLASEAIAAIEERVTEQSPGRFTFNLRLEHADGILSHSVPLILADPRRLREVLDNVLENAVKYSPEGGVIKVRVRPVVQVQTPVKGVSESATSDHNEAAGQLSTHLPQQTLELCVCDTGMGIPVEHLEQIFDRFHRVDTRLTREVNGLGLGLTICKRIVELHEGFIWAENRPEGKGSAFSMRLPMSEVPLD